MRIRNAVAVLAMLFGAICTEAQWNMTGNGSGPAINGIQGSYNAALVQPDCGFGTLYVCDPDWSWHAHNLVFNGTLTKGQSKVQQCMQVEDVGDQYEVDACAEADYINTRLGVGAWYNYITVYYLDRTTDTYTTLFQLNISVCNHCNQPVNFDYWIRFSEVFDGTGVDKFTLNTSPDGTNWTQGGIWRYGRTGQPSVAFTMASGSFTYSSTISIDSWVTHETPGNTTPDMEDIYINQTNQGDFCDTDECAYNGQILYQNQ